MSEYCTNAIMNLIIFIDEFDNLHQFFLILQINKKKQNKISYEKLNLPAIIMLKVSSTLVKQCLITAHCMKVDQ